MVRYLLLLLSSSFWFLCSPVLSGAQGSTPGIARTRPGAIYLGGPIRGTSALRGRGVNPNFNPPGSQSTFQRLNPPGSNSPALNLNPEGSALRPRTAAESGSPKDVKGRTFRYRGHLPLAARDETTVYEAIRDTATKQISWNLWLLERELDRYENGAKWTAAFRLDELRRILRKGAPERFTADERETLASISHRLQLIISDPRYAEVGQLPGFTALEGSLADLLAAQSSDAPEGMASP